MSSKKLTPSDLQTAVMTPTKASLPRWATAWRTPSRPFDTLAAVCAAKEAIDQTWQAVQVVAVLISFKMSLTVSLFWMELADIDCANRKPADTRGRSFMMLVYLVNCFEKLLFVCSYLDLLYPTSSSTAVLARTSSSSSSIVHACVDRHSIVSRGQAVVAV
jgi:hypothetical protein